MHFLTGKRLTQVWFCVSTLQRVYISTDSRIVNHTVDIPYRVISLYFLIEKLPEWHITVFYLCLALWTVLRVSLTYKPNCAGYRTVFETTNWKKKLTKDCSRQVRVPSVVLDLEGRGCGGATPAAHCWQQYWNPLSVFLSRRLSLSLSLSLCVHTRGPAPSSQTVWGRCDRRCGMSGMQRLRGREVERDAGVSVGGREGGGGSMWLRRG